MKANASVYTKSFLFLLICYAPFQMSYAQSDLDFAVKRHLNYLALKGQVRMLVEMKFTAEEKAGKIEQGAIQSKTLYLFNQYGDILEEQHFGPDEKENLRLAYMYDNEGMLAHLSQYKNGVLETFYSFKYDRAGNESGGYSFSTDKRQTYWDTKYNNRGNKIMVFKTLENKDTLKFTCIFDANENLIQVDSLNREDLVFSKSTFRYDEKGKILEKTITRPAGASEISQVYKYNDDGQVIELETDNNGIVNKQTFQYRIDDKRGNWLVRTQIQSPMSIAVRNIQYFY